MPDNLPISLRSASVQDAAALREIYRPYVENTAITFEYDVPSVSEFEERIRHTLENYPYLVCEKAGKAVGYAYLSAFHPRKAYQWCAETSIYLAEDQRGKEIGRMLYEALEKEAGRMNLTNLYACIAYAKQEDEHLTNASMRFHERMGYRLIGEFHNCGYKFHRWYGMIWMEKMIGEHREEMPPLLPCREAEA